jgi:penicillin-binding protein 2
MSVIHAPRQTVLDERQLFVPALVALTMLLFLGRLWFVQIVRADALRAMGVSTGADRVKRLAPRGLIRDRNGVVLAGVQQNAVVTAVYDTVKDHPEAIAEVARLLGVPVERLDKPLKEASWDPYVSSVIWIGVSPEAASVIAEAGDRLPGFGVVLQPTRVYYEPFSLSHVLGYVWKPSEREVKRLKERGIEPQTYVGRAGLEAFYEELLMGTPGMETIAVDPQMRPIRTISIDRPVPGEEVVLALDLRLQRLAHELLGANRGAVVASDPSTGEVLCMVSTPGFDIHLYDNGIRSSDYEVLDKDPNKPMLNRAIQGAYPPGSTFKIVTSVAAQLAGIFDPHRRVTCNGVYRFGNRNWTCLGRHGSVAFREAMAASCNVYFYDLGMRAGQTNLQKAMDLLGLGERQGIDLSSEGLGKAPLPESLAKQGTEWKPYDTVNVSIGQGPLALTPMQMLTVVSIAANGGKAYRPHLLLGTKDAQGALRRTAIETIADLDLPAAFWRELQEALVSVIEVGTAGGSKIEGVRWGGKTGSSQHSGGPTSHGWFVGFAPAQSPRIAIAVIVENAGHGGVVAAPIAKQIVDRYLHGNLERIPEVQSSVRALDNSRTSSAPAGSPDSP